MDRGKICLILRIFFVFSGLSRRENLIICLLLLWKNMSDEGAEAAPAQNAGFFTGNIMNFERPKFNRRLENRLVAIRAFEKKSGYIFKGSLVNISNERKCILEQDWLGPEGQKIYDT